MKRFTLVLLTMVLIVGLSMTATAANRFSVATGNWNATATWSATSGGAAGATAPVAGDVVTIEEGYTVTVNTVTAACASITLGGASRFGNRTGTLTFATTGNPVLTVSGAVQVGATANNASNGIITFVSGASMSVGSLTMGNATTTAARYINNDCHKYFNSWITCCSRNWYKNLDTKHGHSNTRYH